MKLVYHEKYYAKNRECILGCQKRWRTENAEILKKTVVTNGMKTKNGSSAAREPMFKTTNNALEFTTDNTVKTTGNVTKHKEE